MLIISSPNTHTTIRTLLLRIYIKKNVSNGDNIIIPTPLNEHGFVEGDSIIIIPPLKDTTDCRGWQYYYSTCVVKLEGDSTIVTILMKLSMGYRVENIVVNEHIYKCLRPCDYIWSNRNPLQWGIIMWFVARR